MVGAVSACALGETDVLSGGSRGRVVVAKNGIEMVLYRTTQFNSPDRLGRSPPGLCYLRSVQLYSTAALLLIFSELLVVLTRRPRFCLRGPSPLAGSTHTTRFQDHRFQLDLHQGQKISHMASSADLSDSAKGDEKWTPYQVLLSAVVTVTG